MSKHQQSIFNLSGKLGSEFDFKTDFHALSIRVVELIIEQADLMGYRKPKNANGSRARYYWALLQRVHRKGL